MSGLEKIAAGINQAAQQKADEVLAQAKQEAQRILDVAAEVQKKREARCAEAMKKDADDIAARFASENRQRRKQALLGVRSGVIEEIIAEAKNKVQKLPDADYYDLLRGVCVNNAQPGEGKLFFAKKDFDRLPGNFMDQCNAQIQDGSLTLVGSIDTIQNGFVIVYGKIEQNCSVDSIFESKKNEVLDTVNACLSTQG